MPTSRRATSRRRYTSSRTGNRRCGDAHPRCRLIALPTRRAPRDAGCAGCAALQPCCIRRMAVDVLGVMRREPSGSRDRCAATGTALAGARLQRAKASGLIRQVSRGSLKRLVSRSITFEPDQSHGLARCSGRDEDVLAGVPPSMPAKTPTKSRPFIARFLPPKLAQRCSSCGEDVARPFLCTGLRCTSQCYVAILYGCLDLD